jgi:hypothetical protein
MSFRESKEESKEEYKEYVHNIRNMKGFTKEILLYINDLPNSQRLQILQAYNAMNIYYSDMLLNNT